MLWWNPLSEASAAGAGVLARPTTPHPEAMVVMENPGASSFLVFDTHTHSPAKKLRSMTVTSRIKAHTHTFTVSNSLLFQSVCARTAPVQATVRAITARLTKWSKLDGGKTSSADAAVYSSSRLLASPLSCGPNSGSVSRTWNERWLLSTSRIGHHLVAKRRQASRTTRAPHLRASHMSCQNRQEVGPAGEEVR